MKNINTPLLVGIAYIFYVVGVLVAEVGTKHPAYTTGHEIPVFGFMMMAGCFLLGWQSHKEHTKTSTK